MGQPLAGHMVRVKYRVRAIAYAKCVTDKLTQHSTERKAMSNTLEKTLNWLAFVILLLIIVLLAQPILA